MFNYFEDYGYDSCTARGVCSISPRMASIYGTITLYLQEFANYYLKLNYFHIEDENIKNLILNTLSAFVSNPEIPDNTFVKVICTYSKELEELRHKYITACEERAISPEILESRLNPQKGCNLISSIRLGEKSFKEKNEKEPRIHAIHELLFFTAKSLAIKLIELNTFGQDSQNALISIIKVLDSLNIKKLNDNDLKILLQNAAEEEYNLIKELNTLKENLYGIANNCEVNLSTSTGKAIMVDGTNINELAEILNVTKNLNIDIYTHGEMISAHAYPHISEHAHLKGHYGHGSGNTILDFSTFPGAIFIGRHSIDNIDNLYKGRLFTSDIVVPKGVTKIENSDYTSLIQAAIEAKGFKKGQKQAPITLELSKKNLQKIFDDIDFEKYNGICLITHSNDSYENKNYFDKLLKLIPNDILIINFSRSKFENALNINSGYDLNFIFYTITAIKTIIDIKEKPIIAFVPRCDKHITNFVINLKQLGIKKIFIGKCPAKNLNPTVVNEFCKLFNINEFNNVKEDYKTLIDTLSI